MTSIEKGLDHLLKCSKAAASRGHRELVPEDARLLLEKLRCVAFLGGGTFGAVFETASGQAVKLIPQRKSQGLLPTGAHQEFLMQKAFARHGLASRPSAFQQFQCSEAVEGPDAPAEVGALSMPKISWTLDRRLQAGSLSPSVAANFGARLVRLLAVARGAGLVHNDAKCNNISVSSDTADVRFIDFGRAFDAHDLQSLGVGVESATKAVCLGTALDAWRLQESLSRLLDRAPEVQWSAQQKAAVLEPLQTLALRLLKRCHIVPKVHQPDVAWWRDAEEFQKLKAAFSKYLHEIWKKKKPLT